MISNLFGFLTPYKIYLYLAILAILIALSGYCIILRSENSSLEIVNTHLTQIAKDKQDALKVCSDNTIALKNREAEITSNAKEAIELAKVEAVKNYKHSQDLIIKKPKVPVVTVDNSKNYGGINKEDQLLDYLSTHELINEYLDSKASK